MKNTTSGSEGGRTIYVPKLDLTFITEWVESREKGQVTFAMRGVPSGRAITLKEELIARGNFFDSSGHYVDLVYNGDCVYSNGAWMLNQRSRRIA